MHDSLSEATRAGTDAPRPGKLLTPSLRFVRELGRGGMGSVWCCDHLTLQTQVAVKVLNERTYGSEQAASRLSREAVAIARIKSPHVAQVFDHGVANGVPYIVMELIEGEDLAACLRRERRLEPSKVAAIVKQICKGLSQAHAHGIIHRDLKPANIFLTEMHGETVVKVLDFGLSKYGKDGVESLTTSGAVFGTPRYASPEQIESASKATPESDLWSLAVVIYEALTGRLPFDSDSIMGLCVALTKGEFEPASVLRPELPASVDAFFARALASEPSERFRSASELDVALERALRGAEPRRRRALAWGATAAACLVLGLGLLASRLLFASAPAIVEAKEGPPTVELRAEQPPATTSAPAAAIDSAATQAAEPPAPERRVPARVPAARTGGKPVTRTAAEPKLASSQTADRNTTSSNGLFTDPKN